MNLREAVIYITGRDLLKPEPQLSDYDKFRLYVPPPMLWDVRIIGVTPDMAIRTRTGPNVFHRWMQRLILGVIWKRAREEML